MRAGVVEIEATARSEAGKSAAKRLRAAGQVPAVIYGRGADPVAISVDESTFRRALPETSWHSTPVRVVVKGGAASTAMVVQVQRDTIRGRILAIDFHAISLDEPVRVAVPVRVEGESAAVRQGGIVEVLIHEVAVEALPTEIPEYLAADISRLGFHDHLRVSELAVPSGVKILAPPDEALVVITPPAKLEEAAPEEAAAAAAEEPEVVSEQGTAE